MPLLLPQLPITRRGLTDFTFSRFLVPYLCGYEGAAIFVDSDIIVQDDIAKLFDHFDDAAAVSVYKTTIAFERPAVMLFNNPRCKILTPDYIQDARNNPITLDWAEGRVGALPPRWHHIIPYDAPTDDMALIHYTQGVPAFAETAAQPHAERWHVEKDAALRCCAWEELMGASVHKQAMQA